MAGNRLARDKPKLGAGHASAWLRAGFKELGQVMPAFPGHPVQPVEEPGLVGNPTQSEVQRQKQPFQNVINSYANQSAARDRTAERGIEPGQ